MFCITLRNQKELMMACASMFLLLVIILSSCYLLYGFPQSKSSGSLSSHLRNTTAIKNNTKANEDNATSSQLDSMISAIAKSLLPALEGHNSTEQGNESVTKSKGTSKSHDDSESNTIHDDKISKNSDDGSKSQHKQTGTQSNGGNAKLNNDDSTSGNTTNDNTNNSEDVFDVVNVNDEDIEVEGEKFVSAIKTVRVNKVEEVFEDLLAQQVHRVITENRVERVQIIGEEKMDDSDYDVEFKRLFLS